MNGKVPFLLVIAVFAAQPLLAPHPAAAGGVESAFDAVSRVWLESIAPIRQGTNLWVDYRCESAFPITEPATGVLRAQFLLDRGELTIESIDPEKRSAALSRAVFAAPAVVATVLVGAAGTESHRTPARESGLSFADLLAFPDLAVELLDISGGRLRLQERRRDGAGFDIEIVDIRLQGRHLDSTPELGRPRMMLVGSARVAGEGRGALSLQVFAEPGQGTANMQFNIGLDELDLGLLTSFITDEVEFKLESGKLSLLVNGTCREGRFFHADNHLILEEVRFATGNEGTLAELSLAAVTSMLGGTLAVEFPVDGDLTDPNFDLLETYADNAAVGAVNEAADLLLGKLPAEDRAELKEKLIDWVAPDLPREQRDAILGKGR